jgi:hypothetical protein
MDLNAKTQYMETLRERYFTANKKGKGLILDEYCSNTGEERRYAGKKFRYKVKIKEKHERKKKKEYYDGYFKTALVRMWTIFDCCCSQRLESILKTETDNLRRLGELNCSDEVALKLKGVVPSTIDLKLKHEKEVLKLNRKYKKTHNHILKDKVPTKTSEELDRNKIGTLQVDFVEHCGISVSGQYVNSLSMVDIASGWWVGAAVMGKGQAIALRAINEALSRLPFDPFELHPDNGTNLLNQMIYEYTIVRSILLSRSRAYKKNDNCFVEEKNSSTIRHNVGHLRHDTELELEIIDSLYRNLLEPYVNFFLPVIKLVKKERVNGKIHKKYDKPKTPYARLLESNQVPEKKKQELKAKYESLNPAELKRKIDKKILELEKAYDKKKGLASRSESSELNSNFGVEINRSFRSISVS